MLKIELYLQGRDFSLLRMGAIGVISRKPYYVVDAQGGMMKILVIALLLTLVSVASHAQLNGHFGDMDANKDKTVTADEFAKFFPNSKPDDFKKADANGDGGITHDEWHDYKEKNSLGHVDGKGHDDKDKDVKSGQPKS